MSAPVTIDRLDHMVLTVADIDATCAFYGRVLGMEKVVFAGGRTALAFGLGGRMGMLSVLVALIGGAN